MKSVPRSIEEPARFTDVNVLGTLNVLLAARDAFVLRRLGLLVVGVRRSGSIPAHRGHGAASSLSVCRKQARR